MLLLKVFEYIDINKYQYIPTYLSVSFAVLKPPKLIGQRTPANLHHHRRRPRRRPRRRHRSKQPIHLYDIIIIKICCNDFKIIAHLFTNPEEKDAPLRRL